MFTCSFLAIPTDSWTETDSSRGRLVSSFSICSDEPANPQNAARHGGTALLGSCRYRLAALGQRLERRSVTERYPWPKPKARATRVHCHLWYNTGSSATGHCRILRLVRELTVYSCHRDVPLYSGKFLTLWLRKTSENMFYYKTFVNSKNFSGFGNLPLPARLSDIKIAYPSGALHLDLQSRFLGSFITFCQLFRYSGTIRQRISRPSGF